MKKALAVFAVLVFSVTVALAAEHGHGEMKGHGAMKGHEQGPGLGKQVFKGEKKDIKVTAFLNDIASAMKAMEKDSGMKMDMSKMDPNVTHHVAINITGMVKSATLKLTYKNTTKDYALMAMHGHYGSDLAMKEKGTYKAVLLVEGEKGKVEFKFDLKN